MKAQFPPVIVAWVFALLSPAMAEQPLKLSDTQMDRVVAGATGSASSMADALGNLAAQTVTLALSSADSAQGNAQATGLSAASATSLLSQATASSQSAAVARAP